MVHLPNTHQHLFSSGHQTQEQKPDIEPETSITDSWCSASSFSSLHPSLLLEWWTPHASCSSSATANKSQLTAKRCPGAAFQSGLFDELLFPRVRSSSRQSAQTCKVTLRRLLTFRGLLAPPGLTEEVVQQPRTPLACVCYVRHQFL